MSCTLLAMPLFAQENIRVVTRTLPSSSAHKECFALNENQVVRYWYRADALIDFNIQYVEGKKTIFELRRDRQALGSGGFTPKVARDYCMVWTNAFNKPVLFRVELARLAR
ncbi:MAG: hypothetical protein A3H35_19605 [Betaproteobacteria bacterium RIFCSPLOWO2_02_FULL_62_17]|nr:MAG: hypothetical protein A3H35_19605 [Betaproteobacteria bacterium RIFCSPLOWO2_02_FULL_62_17]